MKKSKENDSPGFLARPVNRLSFIKYAGAVAIGTGLLAAGCKDDDETPVTPVDNGIDLGSNDTGILNYAYALEQLEAAFYIQVMTTPFAGMTSDETEILSDIRDHEIAHRDFLKAALGASAIQDLTPDFSSVTFTDRTSVLNTAKTFEDLGVSAYNGAGKLLMDGANLLVAGKIVSVEARHAAAIRDLLSPLSASFAGNDVIIGGLDGQRTPSEVLTAAAPYITNKLDASHLPTS